MPTSELAMLIATCGLAGLAVGLAAYVVAERARSRLRPAVRDLGRRGRPGRRPGGRRASEPSGLPALALPPFTAVARAFPVASVRTPLVDRYARAGWPGGLDDDEMVGIALLVGTVLAALGVVTLIPIAPMAAPLALVLVAAGPGLVSGWLTRQADARDREIARTMPFVLDLLVLTMRSGAPLNTAMERVVADHTGHPIGDEFAAVLAEMEMGVTKSDALAGLAERIPIPAVRTFADDLNQAEELGRPVADTLERLSGQARQRRIQEATELAGRAKVLVLVPGMLVFIASLILLFAPFAVRYYYGGYAEAPM